MGSKPQPGVALLVRVWGMGADGRAFFQNANAHDIRSNGAQLSGIDQQLTPGDVIGVQVGDKKARFRVLQAVDAGLPYKIKVDIELMQGQSCPWQEQLAVQVSTASSQSGGTVAPSNMRRFPRHKIPFPVEIRADRRGGAPMQTSASDVSGRGCYVETLVPLPLGTTLHMAFWKGQERITTEAIVRASISGVGMGIEFTGLSLDAQKQLQHHLDTIDPPAGGFASSIKD